MRPRVARRSARPDRVRVRRLRSSGPVSASPDARAGGLWWRLCAPGFRCSWCSFLVLVARQVGGPAPRTTTPRGAFRLALLDRLPGRQGHAEEGLGRPGGADAAVHGHLAGGRRPARGAATPDAGRRQLTVVEEPPRFGDGLVFGVAQVDGGGAPPGLVSGRNAQHLVVGGFAYADPAVAVEE